MKILMLMDMPFFSYNDELLSDGKFGGGLATVAYNLCLKLVEKSHKVEIVCPGIKHYNIEEGNLIIKFRPELKLNLKNNLTVFGTSKSPTSYHKVHRYFNKLFNQNDYDIVHCHTSHLSVGAVMAANEFSIPIILTIHNYWPICYMNELAIKGKECNGCTMRNFFRCLLTQRLQDKILLPVHMILRNSSMKAREKYREIIM